MAKEIYFGIAIEVLGNGAGMGLQLTGIISPSAGWSIVGVSVIVGFIFICLGIRASVRESMFRQTSQTPFDFEFNDHSITTRDGRILLGVNYFPSGPNTVETLQLEYKGKLFRPKDWLPIEIRRPHTKNYTFDLNDINAIADETIQEAVLIARVNGKEHRSHPFNIYKLL
jgi:hypothetical protein